MAHDDGDGHGGQPRQRWRAGRAEHAGGVGADGEEADVAEVEQAGLADDDVQAEADQDVAADRVTNSTLAEVGVGGARDSGGFRIGSRQQHGADDGAGRSASGRTRAGRATSGDMASPGRRRAGAGRMRSSRCSSARARPSCSPRMPVGRTSSTSTSTTKAIDVPPLRAEDGRAVVLDQPEEQTAEQGAAEVADAAEHGGGERLDAEEEADVEAWCARA